MKVTSSAALLTVAILMLCCLDGEKEMKPEKKHADTVKLPEPSLEGEMSVEEAIKNRRSRRKYRNEALTLKELSQLLWAAQGITGGTEYYRAAPSAGATNPLEIYIVAGNVEGLADGVYHYNPKDNTLELKIEGDLRESLYNYALRQDCVRDAPIDLIFTAVYERTTSRYGDRGVMYVHMEVGHAAQNVYLQAESLNLGTVVVGAFNNNGIKELLNLSKEEPLYIMPVGRV